MGSTVIAAALGAVATIIAAALAYFGQKVMARSQERSKKNEVAGPNWQAFMSEYTEASREQRQWLERRMAQQDETIAGQDTKIETLQRELEDVKLANFDLRSLAADFVDHIRAWRREYKNDKENWPQASDNVLEWVNSD